MSDRILLDPKICHGKPIIRGTRVPVGRVIGYLAGGMSFEDVQRDFDLSAEDVRAALGYAAELVGEQRRRPPPMRPIN